MMLLRRCDWVKMSILLAARLLIQLPPWIGAKSQQQTTEFLSENSNLILLLLSTGILLTTAFGLPSKFALNYIMEEHVWFDDDDNSTINWEELIQPPKMNPSTSTTSMIMSDLSHLSEKDRRAVLQILSEDQDTDYGGLLSSTGSVTTGSSTRNLPSTSSDTKLSLVDPEWENIDPNPDIHTLFQQFNKEFFWGKLGSVEVKWSKQMMLCAGICRYQSRAGFCTIGLSLPLLKLRPRKDLVETLLHEMIHAYLFVAESNREHESHGPQFHEHMYRINRTAGTKITVYHSFHDEVNFYRQHIWRCDGPCRDRRPYFGFVKRSRNRAPGPTDFWFGEHQKNCGGTFHKIKEPEGFGQKKKKRVKDELSSSGSNPPISSTKAAKKRLKSLNASSPSKTQQSIDSFVIKSPVKDETPSTSKLSGNRTAKNEVVVIVSPTISQRKIDTFFPKSPAKDGAVSTTTTAAGKLEVMDDDNRTNVVTGPEILEPSAMLDRVELARKRLLKFGDGPSLVLAVEPQYGAANPSTRNGPKSKIIGSPDVIVIDD